MGAHISGAHYNPAVSFAMLLRKEICSSDFFKYLLSQILGAFAAAFLVSSMSSNMLVQPNLEEPVAMILVAELIFTYLLVFVILNVATHPNLDGNSFYDLLWNDEGVKYHEVFHQAEKEFSAYNFEIGRASCRERV